MEFKLETRHIVIGAVILCVGWMLWSQYSKEAFAPVPFWKPRQFSKYDPFYVYGKEYGEPAYISTYNPLWGNVDETHTAVPMATKIDPSMYQYPVRSIEPPTDEPTVPVDELEDEPVKQEMPMHRVSTDQFVNWARNITGKQICVSVGLLIVVVLIIWYLVSQNNMMSPFKTMSESIQKLFRRKAVEPATTPTKTLGF